MTWGFIGVGAVYDDRIAFQHECNGCPTELMWEEDIEDVNHAVCSMVQRSLSGMQAAPAYAALAREDETEN